MHGLKRSALGFERALKLDGGVHVGLPDRSRPSSPGGGGGGGGGALEWQDVATKFTGEIDKLLADDKTLDALGALAWSLEDAAPLKAEGGATSLSVASRRPSLPAAVAGGGAGGENDEETTGDGGDGWASGADSAAAASAATSRPSSAGSVSGSAGGSVLGGGGGGNAKGGGGGGKLSPAEAASSDPCMFTFVDALRGLHAHIARLLEAGQ